MAKSLILSEREPEISYIKQMALVDTVENSRTIIANNLVLKPWERAEIKIPDELREKTLHLEITGYYEPIRTEALAALLSSSEN